MRTRALTTALVVAPLALAPAGCGEDEDGAEPEPRVPGAVAQRLAGLSDEAADAYEAGDECAAADAASELEQALEEERPRIPRELRKQLDGAVARLASQLECQPAPEQSAPQPSHQKGAAGGADPCPPDEGRKDEELEGEEDGGEGDDGEDATGSAKEKSKDKAKGQEKNGKGGVADECKDDVDE